MIDVMEPQSEPDKKGSDLLLRALSAAVMIPPVLAAFYFGAPYSDVLIFAASLLLSWEWARLCGRGRFETLGSIVLLSVAASVGAGIAGYFSLAVWLIALCAVVVLVYANHHKIADGAWFMGGVLYVSTSCLALLWLRNSGDDGLFAIAWILAVVWATDTGAYFAGRRIGGPKIAPSISPKKTWSGLVGGMIAAALASLLVAWLAEEEGVFLLAFSGALLAVVSQAGDFFESHLKRRFGVKDSSGLIPGHGGLLDRVDGLMAAALALALSRVVGQMGAI